MYAYIIPRPHSVHTYSWPEYRRLAQAGPWSTTAIDGKTLLYRNARDAATQASRASVSHYAAPVTLDGGMVFLPPREPCSIAEFLRPERERPACLVISLPVGTSRAEPQVLHVPVAQAQPRKIKWGAATYADEPAGAYYAAAMALVALGDAYEDARRSAEKFPQDAAIESERVAAYEAYSAGMIAVVSLALPLAYTVTSELLDWGQWLDEGDLPLVCHAALGVDPKKAETEDGESA